MHVFYLPGNNLKGDLELSSEESHHAVKVLRLKPGDLIIITDGTGGLYQARIRESAGKTYKVAIETSIPVPDRNYTVHIAVAPVKNSDRLELMIEKLVELGVDKITFVLTARSERRKLNQERLDKIAVSAMKQSVKGWLTKIEGPVSFREFITTNNESQKFIAHQETGGSKHLKNAANPDKTYLILIGPEGDFTKEEVDEAINAGFFPVSLGNYRLRTETAAISACTLLNIINFKDAE